MRPPKVLLHYSVDDGKFFAIRDFTPGSRCTTPGRSRSQTSSRAWITILKGGDAESSHYHLEGPACADDHVDRGRPQVSRSTPMSRPRSTWKGETSRRSRGPASPFTPRPTWPASLATLDIANDKAAPMEVAAEDPTVIDRQIQGDQVRHLQDQLPDDRQPAQPEPGHLRHHRHPRSTADGPVCPARQADRSRFRRTSRSTW